ncbi:MAG: LAGLIDADG family homing endonuclease [Candidatus Micrarchaeota archaeon]
MAEKQDLSSLISSFEEFFTTIHKEKLTDVLLAYPRIRSVEVDYNDLERFDTSLADALIATPELVVEAAEQAIRNRNMTLPSGIGVFEPHVRFFNGPSSDLMIEHIGSRSLNELVAFKGVVTKRTDVMHKVKMAKYKCQACESEYKVLVGRNFHEPRKCDACKKLALVPVEEEGTFVDLQKAEVQDLLEKVSGGSPAAKMEIWLEDDLVNKITPGENIEVCGILRLKIPTSIKQKREYIYGRCVEAVHVRSLKRDFEEIELNRDDEKRIIEISRDPMLKKKITFSVAPAIYGYNEVKEALALQLFGGTKNKVMKGDAPLRDDVHILLIGDPGLAKCADGDSEVLLADGSVRKIREVVEEVLQEKGEQKVEDGVYAVSNHDLLSLDLDGKVSESKATYFWKLEAPEYMYEVETGAGKKVTVTPEHPFFVSSGGHAAAKKASELGIGEFIATPHFIPVRGKLQQLPALKKGKTNANKISLPSHLDEGFARIIGYLCGDGYFRRTTSYEISLTSNDKDVLDDFASILYSYGLCTSLRQDKRTNAITAFAFSVELGRILARFGMEKTSFEKNVPDEIMKSPDDVAAAFLKAYFGCEAGVHKAGLTVVSASRELLSRVQLLLLRFGIMSQLHETYSRATNAKNHQKTRYHRLFILGRNAVEYGNKIGFTSREKQRKLGSLGKKFNTNMDVIPNISSLIRETRIMLGLTQAECGIPKPAYRHLEKGGRSPSRETLGRVASAFRGRALPNAEKNIRLIELLSESHIFWDKVKSIKKVRPREKWVYDLQVDTTHNFIANGMVVHNTRFLQSITTLAPKSIYVSGKSVSTAGLTASAEKDELGDGGWTLKAGALVLASNGMCAIDEFDKIDEEDRASMHEVMESASVSIAKAGIVAKFKAKTAIIAAANPKHGRFNQTKNLADQFDVPPSLLSRFDLIFPIMDILDEEKDSTLAEHILSSHAAAAAGTSSSLPDEVELIDRGLLKKYIAYARRYVHPVLGEGAKEKIKNFYVELRRLGKNSGSVPITPRYIEGLVRLSEAHAKLRLSNEVEEADADAAITLMRYVLMKVLTDQETGRIDVDIIATGKARSQVEKIESITDIIRARTRDTEAVQIEDVLKDAEAAGIEPGLARRIIRELLQKGDIYEKEPGWVSLVGREK